MPRRPVILRLTRFVFGLATFATFAAVSKPALASIEIYTSLVVDFTQPADAAAKATWSDTLSLAAAGLGWDATPATHKDGWFQTKPLATGVWWRPAPMIGVTVEITPPPAPFALPNGQISTSWRGSVFARYSADKQHWSSWQALDYQAPPDAHDTSPRQVNGIITPRPDIRPLRFTGTLEVPQRNREAYLRHLETYSRLDVPWASDENALAHWIVAKEPDFFARHTPFVGYMEFLFENGFSGGQRITSVKISAGVGLGGTHATPRDPEIEKAMMRDNSPWRFPDPPAPASGEAAK